MKGADDHIQTVNVKLSVLQRLKRGLMQDLLTGRRRVRADIPTESVTMRTEFP